MNMDFNGSLNAVAVDALAVPLPGVPPTSPVSSSSSSSSSTSSSSFSYFLSRKMKTKDDDKTHNTTLTEISGNLSINSIRSTTLVIRGEEDGVETSQVTVNTHNSILNIAEEEEDEETSTDIQFSKSFLIEEESVLAGHLCNVEDKCGEENTTTKNINVQQQHCIPQTPPTCRPSAWCERVAPGGEVIKAPNVDGSLFEFVDSLCFSQLSGSSIPSTSRSPAELDVMTLEQYRRILEYDIVDLLGCSNPPYEEEISRVWQFSRFDLSNSNDMMPCNGALSATDSISCINESTHAVSRTAVSNTSPKVQTRRSRRQQWRERAIKVRRLRMEQMAATFGNGYRCSTPLHSAPYPMTSKSISMDDRMLSTAERNRHRSNTKKTSWSLNLFGSEQSKPDSGTSSKQKMDAILREHDGDHEGQSDDGYDSDPEELAFRVPTSPKRPSRSSNPNLMPLPSLLACKNGGSRDWSDLVVDTVQETLNMSWTLTWHPGPNNKFRDPRMVHVWIERGTLVESNTVMLEPNLMWKEVFHPNLTSKRKLNATSQKPHGIRLLNLCRILTTVNRNSCSLVRPSCCILLLTSDGQEVLFEGADVSERDDVVARWKLTTARFATLAVLEDLETICNEFFTPKITSRMLIPEYNHANNSNKLNQGNVESDSGEEVNLSANFENL